MTTIGLVALLMGVAYVLDLGGSNWRKLAAAIVALFGAVLLFSYLLGTTG